MKIHEYQGKELFRKHGMVTPRGFPCFSVDEAVEAAKKLGGSVAAVVAMGEDREHRGEDRDRRDQAGKLRAQQAGEFGEADDEADRDRHARRNVPPGRIARGGVERLPRDRG